jgi:hypothetical protein
LPSPHQNQELHLWHDHPPVAPKHHSINKTAGNTAETKWNTSRICPRGIYCINKATTETITILVHYFNLRASSSIGVCWNKANFLSVSFQGRTAWGTCCNIPPGIPPKP